MKNSKTSDLVKLSFFVAIIVLMAVTPFLGYIPLGFTRATIIHVPVIIGSIMMGPVYGAIMGFVFGLTSFLNNTFNPTVTSFVFTPFYSLGTYSGNFWSLVIVFVPRILVGIVPHYVYKGIKKIKDNDILALGVAGVAGSLTNTLLVMNMIYLFFGESYASVRETDFSGLYAVILSVIAINGVPEAIVAGILTVAVCKALLKITQKPALL
ncbi:ECF transporter S component [Eubacteriaceae bacterium ES3]|nr:ECF transporter S component [Eubacteriaceae bacterium ES3]